MEKWEIILGIIDLFLALLGLVLIIFGWVIPYKQRLVLESQKYDSEIKLQRLKWEKELIDNQISLLYGPVSILLNKYNLIRDKIFKLIGRNYIFDENHRTLDSLPSREQKIWIHYVEEYKIPLNNKICDIISQSSHLIYNSENPKGLYAFIDYTIGWELSMNQYKSKVPNDFQYFYHENFPSNFVDYIHSTLSVLLRRQAEITGFLKES